MHFFQIGLGGTGEFVSLLLDRGWELVCFHGSEFVGVPELEGDWMGGTLVEMNPLSFMRCYQLFCGQDGLSFMNVAVAGTDRFGNVDVLDFEGIDLNCHLVNDNRNLVSESKRDSLNYGVFAISLQRLLLTVEVDVGLVAMDVGGLEGEILNEWIPTKYPKFFVIEIHSDENRELCKMVLRNHGYRFVRDLFEGTFWLENLLFEFEGVK